MRKFIKYIKHFIIFFFLTIVSQIGGIVYVISSIISKRIKVHFRFKGLLIFSSLYLLSTFIIVPIIVPIGGRERIINTSNLKPVNQLTILLNRNYVTPELNSLLKNVSDVLMEQNSDIEIRYLDACFPFINGFPLLPHFSHNDGEKVDLSLVYENKYGIIINKSKSRSGYGVFVAPKPNEFNHTEFAKNKGYIQYDYPKYLTLGKINRELKFSSKGTKTLILAILKQKNLGKIFIEPNLKNRLNLNDNRIRFQGYGSVRHDDHIHIQLKR